MRAAKASPALVSTIPPVPALQSAALPSSPKPTAGDVPAIGATDVGARHRRGRGDDGVDGGTTTSSHSPQNKGTGFADAVAWSVWAGRVAQDIAGVKTCRNCVCPCDVRHAGRCCGGVTVARLPVAVC